MATRTSIILEEIISNENWRSLSLIKYRMSEIGGRGRDKESQSLHNPIQRQNKKYVFPGSGATSQHKD